MGLVGGSGKAATGVRVTGADGVLKNAVRMYAGSQLIWGAPPPALIDVTDDFNRSDAANLGAEYSHPTANYHRVVGNRADPIAAAIGSQFCVDVRNDVSFTSNNHRVTQTVSTANALCLLSVRSNASHQVTAWLYSGSTGQISIATGYSYASKSNTAAVPGWSVAPGDRVSFEAVGEYYIVRKNGVMAQLWRDMNYSYHPHVDATHRDCVIGSFAPAAGVGIDTVRWQDLGTNYFLASRMIKNGAQAWATSSTWTTIGAWTASNTATAGIPGYTSVVDSSAVLRVLTSKQSAVLSASIPFTGSAAGRSHTVRIVRVAGSVVVATGSPVVGASGTCVASATVDVTAGEQYRVEMNSDGASAGTVTATTSELTLT